MKTLKWKYANSFNELGFYWDFKDGNGRNQKLEEYLQVKQNNPVTAQNIYQAEPGNRQGTIFVESDFSFYEAPPGLAFGLRGEGVEQFLSKGTLVVQGWDTAFSATNDSDFTVCVTALFVPCSHYHRNENELEYGECEHHYDVIILDVWREKAEYAEVLQAIRSQYFRWQPNMILVEKKAYGVAALEALQNSNMPLVPVTPVDGKRARAVEGIGAASVHGWFRRHRVAFPVAPEGTPPITWMPPFVTELKDFTGEKGGRDDQADALIHVVQFAIREGTMAGVFPTDWDSAEKVDRRMGSDEATGGDRIAGLFALAESSFDAFLNAGLIEDINDGTCSRCQYFWKDTSMCGYHRIKTMSIGTCDNYSDPDFMGAFGRAR